MTLSAIGMPKLFCFQPKGFGEYSAFVMADTEEEAKECVMKAFQEHQLAYEEYSNCDGLQEMLGFVERISMENFNTDYYKVTVLNYGEVAFSANE